jgi:site-specific DNA-methyltransferase (adenine-specific)
MRFEINKIYNLDVFEYLDIVPNNSIDLIITDPPYNMKKADWDTFKSHKDFLDFTFSWIDESLEKLKPNGSLYIFNTPFNSAYILQYLIEKGLYFKNWITWEKKDGLGYSKRKFATTQETILFFTKHSTKYTFNADEIRIPYESNERIKHAQKKGILKNGKRWFPNPKGKLCPDVWHFSSQRHKEKVNGKTVKLPHLTPKPIDMIERMIKASSNERDLIMDPFMGIGTTAIAAIKLNRNFTGTEREKKYFETANKKIQEMS